MFHYTQNGDGPVNPDDGTLDSHSGVFLFEYTNKTNPPTNLITLMDVPKPTCPDLQIREVESSHTVAGEDSIVDSHRGINRRNFPILSGHDHTGGRIVVLLRNSGRLTKGTWTTKKQIHDINVPCVGILFYTSGLEVVLPLKQWNSRTEPGGSNDDKIFLMKYPLPFLE